MPRYLVVLLPLVGLALGACERRPSDPPKPITLAQTTPATAGLAPVALGPDAKPPHGPASDPPKSPLPPPRPPSQPSSGAAP